MRRLIAALGVWLLLGGSVWAQPVPSGAKVTVGAADASAQINIGGETIVTSQIQGTWVGTMTFEASLDGQTYTAVNVTPSSATTAVTTTTANGIWSASISGMNFFRVRMSAYTSGAAIVSFQTFYVSGGSGGGGGGTSSSVSIIQGGNTAAVNGSSQLSVNCANCSGSGVSQQDNTGFVPGTTNFVPVGGEVDDVGTSAATENSAAAARITVQRGLHVNLRTVAGAETGIAATPLQVSLANTAANATAVKVDGSAVTQPVSAASLPLPTGASTAAKQPALGTAGTASADVITVQGIASMTALKVDGSAVTQPVSGTVTANQGGTWTVQPGNTANTTAWKVDGSAVTQPVSGTVTANAGSGTFAVGGVVAKDAPVSGNPVYMGGFASAAAPADVSADGDLVPPWLLRSGAQVVQPAFAGVLATTGNGVSGTSVQRFTLASDSTGQVTLATGANTIGALTANQSVNVAQMNGVATTMGNGVAGTGVQRVAVASDNTAFETIPVSTASTTNGLSTCYLTSAASTNSTNCKASAGNVYAIHVTNTTTTNYFLRLYNSSSAPTCSSATGFVETVPALGASANGGVNGRINGAPQAYATGIGFCLTGGGSNTDNTNAATGVYITVEYK